METCFDKKFKEQNLNWDGDCGGEVCWEGGYTMMGMCAKGTKCTGFATMAQIDDIHNQCDETARTDYMKGGGKVDEWDVQMMEGAETAGVDMMHSCFDKKFDAAGYKWEGTCGEDPTKICFDEEG